MSRTKPKGDRWAKEIEDAFDVARQVLEEPGAFPDRFVVLPADAEEIARITTPERLRLLQKLTEKGGYPSVDDLAHDLRRHQSRVSRDLSALEKTGIVRTRREGAKTRIEATSSRVMINLRDLSVRKPKRSARGAKAATRRA